MGVNGPPEGKYDLKFVRWCQSCGHSSIRTVHLFWAFQYHRGGFPMTFSEHVLRQVWEEQDREKREVLNGTIQVLVYDGEILDKANERPLAGKELHDYVKYHYDFGPWRQFYRSRKAYFFRELDRYKRVLKFWRECGPQVRKTFLRCARYSNKRPESHPGYLIVFRNIFDEVVDSGFVEVKGPRESLRPSQRRFSPELVNCAGQNVWLARFNMRGTGMRLEQFTSGGQLTPYSRSFERASYSSRALFRPS